MTAEDWPEHIPTDDTDDYEYQQWLAESAEGFSFD